MEDRLKKKRKIASYVVNTYFICVIIYFTVLKFVFKIESTEYNILEKLTLLSAPLVQIIITFTKKLYYATIFWIVFGLIGAIGFFFI